MRGNTITIELPLKRGKVSKTIPLYQYDYGQKLIITDVELPSYYEVHFSNEMHGDAVTSIGDSTGVEIPDSLLATGENVYLWLYLHDSDSDGETEFQGAIPVIRRARVTDQTPTPHERTIIEQAVSALNSAVSDVAGKVEDAEAAQIAAEAAQAAAETAQSKAEDAQEAAETAQDAAEDAQTAAETAQGKAEDAQGAAETAQGKAEDAQGAAESAQSAAEGFAGNASDSADDAEAWAVGTEDSTHPAHGNSAKDWAEEAAEVVQGIIDDTAGDGDTDKTWSADKMHDQFALKADKWDPTIYGKISHGRKGGSTAGTNSAVIGGDNAVASGSHAVAEGQFTIAAGAYQRASGKFNVEDSNGTYAEIVGNGYAEIDEQTFDITEHRSNARVLDWNGNERLKGDLYVGCNDDSTGGSKVATETGLASKADKASPVFTGSISMGRVSESNKKTGTNSVAMGNNVRAMGAYSNVTGDSTIGMSASGHVFGEYNIPEAEEWQANKAYHVGDIYVRYGMAAGQIINVLYFKCNTDHTSSNNLGNDYAYWDNVSSHNLKYVEIVGNGYAEMDDQTFVVTEHRSNARTLDWNGNETLAGDLTVNKGKTNEMNLGSEVSNLKNEIDDLPTDETAQELLAYEERNAGLTDTALAVIGLIFQNLPQDETATNILHSLSLECERLQTIYENWLSERSA